MSRVATPERAAPREGPKVTVPRAPESTALAAARDYLLSIQKPAGEWCAELEGDTILESEYVLTMHYLGRTGEARVRKAAEYIRRKQLGTGGWAIYPGGPAEPSASVKAYFVLKLMGDDPDAAHMVKAREAILAMGGIEACNSFTKIYLSIFGQYDWQRCPAVPPSMILLPTWFPFNIYEMSSWSRAIVVPLSIIWAFKPTCDVPDHADISELRIDARAADITKYRGRNGMFWTRFFRFTDWSLKALDHLPFKPFRLRALQRAERWILERLEGSDGLAGIFPPIINTIIAFHCLGYDLDHPVMRDQIGELEKLEIEEAETLRVQPCFSALWDTAQVLNALLDAGVAADHPALLEATRWILAKEVTKPGDWCVKNPDTPPAGWYFEYANEPYPDCDDTAEVLIALAKVRFPDEREESDKRAAMQRGLRWLLSMQNEDGGWAAFDKGCDREFLTHIPFADHNAMLDPSCEDITARTLEALDGLDYAPEHPVVRRAVDYLSATQEPDGSWFGRWGSNFIYGTWLAMTGLRRAGVAADDPRLTRAADWLRAHQSGNGGWGELPRSYDDPSTKGRGPSTAAQTAWALLGLFSVGEYDSPRVRAGLDYLLVNQRSDGSWHDEHWTGTGFPRVFYLRYHLYATQFPLMALAAYRKHHELQEARGPSE